MVFRGPQEKVGLIFVSPPFSWPSPSADLSNNGLVVDEVSEVYGGGQRIVLIVDAGAAGLFLLPLGHNQLVPREAQSLILSCCLIIMEMSLACGPQLSHPIHSVTLTPSWWVIQHLSRESCSSPCHITA